MTRRSSSRRKLWGAIWLIVAAGVFRSGYWDAQAEIAAQEAWPKVVAEVSSSEVAYNDSIDQFELRVRLTARFDGAILHDEMPRQRGSQQDLLRELETEFFVGAVIDSSIDPSRPGVLLAPVVQSNRPIFVGLVPAAFLGLLGLRLLLTATGLRRQPQRK